MVIRVTASATALNEAYNKFLAKCDFLHREEHQLILVDKANQQVWLNIQKQLQPPQEHLIKHIYGEAQVSVGMAAQPHKTGGVAPGTSSGSLCRHHVYRVPRSKFETILPGFGDHKKAHRDVYKSPRGDWGKVGSSDRSRGHGHGQRRRPMLQCRRNTFRPIAPLARDRANDRKPPRSKSGTSARRKSNSSNSTSGSSMEDSTEDSPETTRTQQGRRSMAILLLINSGLYTASRDVSEITKFEKEDSGKPNTYTLNWCICPHPR